MPEVDQKYAEEKLYRGGWFKSTQLTYDPVGATTFAVELLGFTAMQSPYPETPQQMADTGCTLLARETRWALGSFESNATSHAFWLHFVNSNSTATEKGQTQPTAFMRDIVSRRTADVFDVWMYTSLIFAVDSIEPYKTKLRNSARSAQPDSHKPVPARACRCARARMGLSTDAVHPPSHLDGSVDAIRGALAAPRPLARLRPLGGVPGYHLRAAVARGEWLRGRTFV